jgi:integrase
MQTWTTDEARVFLRVAITDDLSALWLLALNSGIRRGELLALRWQDVDLDRGALAIRRTLTRGTGALTFGEPKSKAGRRSLALPAVCVDALRAHRVKQLETRLSFGSAWNDTDLIFERGDGSLLHPNTLLNAFFRLTAAAGVPRIRFHDLRHTSATLMLANGEHPKIVQERLGHSDISMTLNRYSHVTMDMQRDAADRLAELLA